MLTCVHGWQVAGPSGSAMQRQPANVAVCDPPDASIGYEAALQGAQVCSSICNFILLKHYCIGKGSFKSDTLQDMAR